MLFRCCVQGAIPIKPILSKKLGKESTSFLRLPRLSRRWWRVAAGIGLVFVLVFYWNHVRLKKQERQFVGHWTQVHLGETIPPASVDVRPDHMVYFSDENGPTWTCHWRVVGDRIQITEQVPVMQTGKRFINSVVSRRPMRKAIVDTNRIVINPAGHILFFNETVVGSKEFEKEPYLVWKPVE